MTEATTLWQTAGHALQQYLRQVDGSVVEVGPAGWLALSGAPIPETNMAALAAHASATQADYAATLSRFVSQARGRQTPLLVLLPQTVLDVLSEVPAQLGLEPVGAIPLMTRQTLTVVPAGNGAVDTADGQADGQLAVDRVTGADDLALSQALISETFGLPLDGVARYVTSQAVTDDQTALFLARRDGEPVGTVLAVRTGDMVGLRFMATAPARQRQGIGRALLEHVIRHYAELGVGTVYLGTTEAGYQLYERSGFVVVEQTPVWIAMP